MPGPPKSRSFVPWGVPGGGLADGNPLGAADAVADELLVPVGTPAGDAGEGEDRREHISRDDDRVVDDAREEVDVRVDSLRAVDGSTDALQFERDLVVGRPARLGEHVLGDLLEHGRAAV